MNDENEFVIDLPSPVSEALMILRSHGFSCYVVGGSVRDALRKVTPNDYDITTNAYPEDMKKCFANYRTVDTGLKHGTLTVIIRSMSIEITTFRIDGEYTDNRHPSEVFFTDNITDDLSRRDFTVNAMAYSPMSGLYDPFGGCEHLKEKIICCVGEPSERFDEDGLRILRALRFASVLGFRIEKATEDAICNQHSLLKNISAERIYSEFCKLINKKGAYDILVKYRCVFEEFINICFDDEEYKYRCGCIVKAPEKVTTRLAILFGSRENAINNCERLKTSNADKARITALASLSQSEFRDKISVKRAISLFGNETVLELCDMKKALGEENADAVKDIASSIAESGECTSIAMLDITGNDVMSLGVVGKNIGIILSELLAAVMEERLPNVKSELVSYARVLAYGMNE